MFLFAVNRKQKSMENTFSWCNDSSLLALLTVKKK
ncbi:MAG: hypothetical protein ACI9CZ_000465, partial [Flavobacterium sp.]